jgi:uncharacterized protein GlcG (DUF336 family)
MRWTSGVQFAPHGPPTLRGSFWFFLFLVFFAHARAQTLPPADVARVYAQAAEAARELQPQAVIAIVDRDGRALWVRRADGSGTVSAAERAIAVSKAGTGVFLSSNQQAFSSRTAGFIIQQNFPPRVLNRPPGPLVGVGFSNLAFSDVNYFRETDGRRIPGSRLYGSPGGVPLYLEGKLVAGVGVTGDGTEQEDASIVGEDVDEIIALSGQVGYAPADAIRGSHVFLDGIRVPYVNSAARRPGTGPAGPAVTVPEVPAVVWPTAVLGGVAGEVRSALRGDPVPGTIDGQARLSAAEVRQILSSAAARTLVTRAGIRLPAGVPMQVFITVVNNPNQPGQAPAVLGTFRTPDATVFSWDVAAQKARTALFFSSNTRAYSARTVGFLAQSNYPPGLQNQAPGPFNGLQERFSLPVLVGPTAGAVNGNLPNGITIFPGGFPLYRNGVLIGAIGVSGDGIEQDDLVAAAGTVGFQPDIAIRADTFTYRGARLPYAKFPRDAEARPAGAAVAGFAAGGPAEAPGDFLNLSARGYSGPDGPLILGFVTDSAGPAALLLRGIGPGLAQFSIPDALTAPSLVLRNSAGVAVAENAAWARAGNAAEIVATSARVGAFPLATGSADNAVLTALAAGAYTVTVGPGAGGAGTALAEIYGTAAPAEPGTLRNISIRGRVAGDEQPLMAGLVVAPGAARTVLIRGIGPSLADFGVAAPLGSVRLRLFNSAGQLVVEGAPSPGDSNAAEIRGVAAAVGAFPLAADATDPALLVALGPGSYTIEVTGRAGSAGEVLAEVYAVP